jgi:hypothetical protein
MTLSAEDLAVLMNAFEESDWTELALSIDGIRLTLTKTGQAGAAGDEQAQRAAAARSSSISP